MIVQEKLDNGLIKTYSNIHHYIQGGFPEAMYTEAIDPEEMHREYIETDVEIEDENL